MNRGKTERLLNLVFALMATANAVSREEIRRSVSGYENCSSDEAFERMFERDKDELRSMGLPVETVSNAFDEVLGYRISLDRYEFVDIDLTSRDLEILSIATRVWDEAVLGNAANTAQWKIEANTKTSFRDSDLVGVARIRAESASMVPLLQAARERKVVTFNYQALGQRSEKRTFEPWSVICRSGRWYTVGYDQVRGQERTFNLSRIIGPVKITAKAAQSEHPRSRFSEIELPDNEHPIEARILISKSGGAELRKHASLVELSQHADVIHITATQSRLIPWILGTLPEVIGIEPIELHESIFNRLNAMLAAYCD